MKLSSLRTSRNLRRWSGCIACFAYIFGLGAVRAEETRLEILHYFDVKDQLQGLTEIVTEYQASHPDVKITLTYVPFADLLSRTLQSAAVKRPPSIAVINNPDVLRVARAGVLKDLSGSLDRFPTWAATYEGPRNAVTNGQGVYGIPVGSNSLALFYNKKMLADAGIAEPPKTWDQLAETAAKVTKGTTYGIAFSATNSDECTWQWEPFLWSNGGSLLELASDKAKQALRLWVDLVQKGQASRAVVNWNQGDVATQFLGGQAAMMVMGPWMLPAVKRSGLEFGVVPIPVPEAGEKPVVPLGGEVWCVMKTDHKTEDAAVDFVRFTQEPARLEKLCLTFNYVSACRDVAEKEGQVQPDLQPFVAQMETARAMAEQGGTDFAQISQVTRVAVQKALTGQASVDAALGEAAAEIEKLIPKKHASGHYPDLRPGLTGAQGALVRTDGL